MRFAVWVLVAVVCSGVSASEPGQPLDCSDFVILDSRLTCSIVVPFPCLSASGQVDQSCTLGNEAAYDNEEGILYYREVRLPDLDCTIPVYHARYNIVRLANGVETVLAHAENRCGIPPNRVDSFQGYGNLLFDSKNGVVSFGGTETDVNQATYYGGQRFGLRGFATDFEVLQTYTPQGSLGFTVPYMPEGLAGADHFDTYWGDLAHPIEFTQARPLACDPLRRRTLAPISPWPTPSRRPRQARGSTTSRARPTTARRDTGARRPPGS